MFHHDPAHDDARLDAVAAWAKGRWDELGSAGSIELAREGQSIELGA
jgi:hypothetical protein